MPQDIDCRQLGARPEKHASHGLRPVCGVCYNNLLRKWRQEKEAVRAARLEADKLRDELEEAHSQVRGAALALGRIIEG